MTINRIKDYGFKPQPILPDQYVFGVGMVPMKVLQKDGQWNDFLPTFEKQFNGDFETYGCTVFNTLNPIEVLIKRLIGVEKNYADRELYIRSKTIPPGNDPHVVAENVRSGGLVKEEALPFREDIDNFDEFNSLEGKEESLRIEGENWLKEFIFLHEWVFNGSIPLADKQNLLMKNLTFSPLGISVRAWQQRDNGLYYKELNEQDTHWCYLIGYVQGKYWIIADTYPTSDGEPIKYLEWNYDFGFCKRYYLEPKLPEIQEKKVSIYELIINFIKKYLKIK